MQVKCNILTQKEYREQHYLSILNKINRGFYQKNGFIVSPTAKLKNASEVVFPKYEILDNASLLSKFYSNTQKDPTYPFALPLSEFAKLGIFIKELDNIDIDLNTLNKIIDSQIKNIEEFLAMMNITLDVDINIIPVNFGTARSFLYKKVGEHKVEFYFTYRYDLGTSNILQGFIPSVITYLGEEQKDKFSLMDTSIDWFCRQGVIDFLCTQTSYGKSFGGNYSFDTLSSIENLNQLADIVIESHKYLQDLKFDYFSDIKLEKNILVLNESQLILTDFETKLMAYLMKFPNIVCSVEELGDQLWDSEEDFSMYALSKHISNIRKKIKSTGYINDLLYVSRGSGVMLKI